MTIQTRWHHLGTNAAEIYERILVPGMFAPWAPTLLDLAGVRPGERVLDVACGTGVVARLAAERVGIGGRVAGLDFSTAMLAVARALPAAGGADIEWIEANAAEMPLPDKTFDVVACQHGLQQFPDRPGALREMCRVLAAGGRLALCVWSRIEGSPGMAALVAALERHVSSEAADNRRAPFRLGDADELRSLVDGAGFRDVRLQTLVQTARFESPQALVDGQLAATPLATLGSLSDQAYEAVVREVRDALAPYVHAGELAVPMEAHVLLAGR